jgi:hypothetical protein
MAALSDALASDTLLFGVQLPMIITRANRPAGTPSTTLIQNQEKGLLAPHDGHALAWSLISLLHSGQVVMAMLGFLVQIKYYLNKLYIFAGSFFTFN